MREASRPRSTQPLWAMVRAVDVGFYQRGDVIGLVFQVITLTLCRKQRGQGLGMEREVGQEKLGNQVETAALVWVSNGGGRKQGAGSAYI